MDYNRLDMAAQAIYDIVYDALPPQTRWQEIDRVKAVLRKVCAEEREECAKIVECHAYGIIHRPEQALAGQIASQIRATFNRIGLLGTDLLGMDDPARRGG